MCPCWSTPLNAQLESGWSLPPMTSSLIQLNPQAWVIPTSVGSLMLSLGTVHQSYGRLSHFIFQANPASAGRVNQEQLFMEKGMPMLWLQCTLLPPHQLIAEPTAQFGGKKFFPLLQCGELCLLLTQGMTHLPASSEHLLTIYFPLVAVAGHWQLSPCYRL